MAHARRDSMTDHELPSHAELEAHLRQARLGLAASELHGALCGYLSRGGEPERRLWLQRVMADPEVGAVDRDSLVDDLYTATTRQLESPDFGFDLLLPDADEPLVARADGLLDWCRGFLGGFGLAASGEAPLSDESRDALGDLSRIAASELSYDDPDGDEEALEEVAEFVRVAALLLYSDCVLGPRHRRSLN